MNSQEVKQNLTNSLIKFKKDNDYIIHLNAEIKKQGFLTLDEKAYNIRIKEFAVFKSKIVSIFSDEEKIAIWLDSASPKEKSFLYNLAKDNQFVISKDELSKISQKNNSSIILDQNIYKLNENYSEEKASKLQKWAIENFKDYGDKYNSTKIYALEMISKIENDWDTRQSAMKVLIDKFDLKYDDVWQDFKLSAKVAELEQDENSNFIFSSRVLPVSQQLKIQINKKMEITSVSTVPPGLKKIEEIRSGLSSHNKNNLGIK